MNQADLSILSDALDWQETGLNVALLTVIKTHGPSPRPLGAIMAINEKGEFAGSVSGGCIEQDLLEHVTQTAPHHQPEVRCYGGNAEQQRRFQLPCGGTVEVCLEWLDDHPSLQILVESLQSGQSLARSTNLHNGDVTLSPSTKQGAHIQRDQDSFTRFYGPQWRLFLVGAGDLSQQVAQLAQHLDYHIIACDPREEYAHAWQLPGTTFLRNMPDDALRNIHPDARCAVLTLTHDPKLDDMALLEALTSPAFYIGALGSRRSAAQRLERLHYMGLTNMQTDRLHAPAGLPIGSHSAAEIAISILAQLVQVQNQQPAPLITKPTTVPQQVQSCPAS